MFQNYSGTFFAVITMIVVPVLVQQFNFTQGCADEIGSAIGTGALVLMARYFKGGVNVIGVRSDTIDLRK